MTDDPDLDPPGPDEQRAALRHIIGYRQLRRGIRESGTGTLFWGLLLMGLWYLAFFQPGRGATVLGLIHLALAAAELVTGLAKKLVPVPETFLLEALVFVGFAAARAYNLWDLHRQGMKPPVFSIVFGLYVLFVAWGRVQTYRDLTRTRFRRPGLAQLRWFDELLAETRSADPEADPNGLDLPTRPPVRAKLLGDLALVISPRDDDPAVVARADFQIDRRPARGERPLIGLLSIEGEDAGTFPLDDANWRNYAAWKTAGGDPPPPLATAE